MTTRRRSRWTAERSHCTRWRERSPRRSDGRAAVGRSAGSRRAAGADVPPLSDLRRDLDGGRTRGDRRSGNRGPIGRARAGGGRRVRAAGADRVSRRREREPRHLARARASGSPMPTAQSKTGASGGSTCQRPPAAQGLGAVHRIHPHGRTILYSQNDQANNDLLLVGSFRRPWGCCRPGALTEANQGATGGSSWTSSAQCPPKAGSRSRHPVTAAGCGMSRPSMVEELRQKAANRTASVRPIDPGRRLA